MVISLPEASHTRHGVTDDRSAEQDLTEYAQAERQQRQLCAPNVSLPHQQRYSVSSVPPLASAADLWPVQPVCLLHRMDHTYRRGQQRRAIVAAQCGSKLNRWPQIPSPRYPTFRSMKFCVEIDWMGSERRYYTPDEVARHNTPGDVWLVANGKVYDATSWVHDHPGGMQSILTRAGGVVDASRDLGFHSSKAQKRWESLYLGELEAPKKSEGSGCTVM